MSLPFAVKGVLEGLSVRLSPAATIAGKVLHGDGEPAAGFVVQAYRELTSAIIIPTKPAVP